jgi:hypothetical protein
MAWDAYLVNQGECMRHKVRIRILEEVFILIKDKAFYVDYCDATQSDKLIYTSL